MIQILKNGIRLRQSGLVCMVGAALLMSATACQAGGSKKPGQIVSALDDATVITEYEGGKITAKDVKDQVEPQIKRLNEEAMEAYKKVAERVLITRLVEAEVKKQGVSSPEELLSKIGGGEGVTDAQVKEFIKTNDLAKGYKDPRTGKMRKVTDAEIKSFLEEQGKQGRQQNFLQGLLAAAKVRSVLEEPRVKVDLPSYSPAKGGQTAKVVIQEFSDFQCPFCSRGKDVVTQIAKAYGDKVKIVFRNFPLDFHPEAKPSALAGICAQDQGKFWELHDKMFDNQKTLNEDARQAWVKELGLDNAKFEACVKDPKTAQTLEKDLEAARVVGVNSTPTFFVNGKRVAGALPFEQFRSIIDAELRN